MSDGPRPFVGLVSGIAAGLVASAAIAAFRSVTPLLDQAPEGHAEIASGTPTGTARVQPHDEARDRMAHYVVGAVVGGIFGLLTEYRPEASAGFGSAYGVATATLVDQSAFDLDAGDGPEAYGLAAPVIFGVVLEGIRALLGGRR